MDGRLYTVAEDIDLWIADGGSIHIKTRDPHGDPGELSEEQALELASVLNMPVAELRN